MGSGSKLIIGKVTELEALEVSLKNGEIQIPNKSID